MPHSMTGFATAEARVGSFRLFWEIRSVNHRFLELGVRAPEVSHPELLDWLAVEFMEPSTLAPGELKSDLVPWSMKHIHRLIVNSAVYKQESKVNPNLLEKDPYNRLLARAPRFRVEGEIVRDIALAASGLLNPKLGGPSVMPPAP